MLKKQNIPSFIIGIILIIFGIAAIFNSFYLGFPERIFWFCYAGLILIGIGIIKDNGDLVASQLSILTLPFIVWNIDFFYILLSNNSLWGLTDYFFNPGFNTLGRIITFQHIFTLPLSYAFLFFHRPKRKDFWIISIIQITILYLIVKFLTPEASNINCVFKSCLPLSFPWPYPITWFAIYALIITITSLIIAKIFYRTNKKKHKK